MDWTRSRRTAALRRPAHRPRTRLGERRRGWRGRSGALRPRGWRPTRRRRAGSARACGRGRSAPAGPSRGWPPWPRRTRRRRPPGSAGGRPQRRQVVLRRARRAPRPAGRGSPARAAGRRAASSTGRRRWKTLCGKSKLKNVASHFSNWVARRQHVVGQPRRLGHGTSITTTKSSASSASRMRCCRRASAPGCRSRRSWPGSGGVVGEDLLGDHVARHEPGDDAGTGDRADPRRRRRAAAAAPSEARPTTARTARPAGRSCRSAARGASRGS